jgi:hypothetical protein
MERPKSSFPTIPSVLHAANYARSLSFAQEIAMLVKLNREQSRLIDFRNSPLESLRKWVSLKSEIHLCQRIFHLLIRNPSLSSERAPLPSVVPPSSEEWAMRMFTFSRRATSVVVLSAMKFLKTELPSKRHFGKLRW